MIVPFNYPKNILDAERERLEEEEAEERGT
jgi:hypothetical protein